ncbi:MAG TPA: AsmA family protein [Alphaproteobacteria bacterium]|nr:AsmA family protein [Alphaproteobacteria bacterium]
MSAAKKVLLALVSVAVLFVVAVAIAALTINPDKYRGQIADALSKQIGRTVTLGGPIHFDLSTGGIALGISDVAVGNARWARQPQMAKIGKLELGVALMPLFSHRLVVTRLDIDHAGIDLETAVNGENNWVLKTPTAPASPPQKSAPTTAPGAAVGIRIDELSISDSQLSMRDDRTGKLSAVKVKDLTLKPSAGGTDVSFNGTYNGAPVTLDLTADTTDLLGNGEWPFAATAGYGAFAFKGKGKASLGHKIVDLDSYQLAAGHSTLSGHLVLDLAGAKPSLHGTLTSDTLDVADFKPASPGSQNAPASASSQSPGPKRLFSTAPLDLGALKSADANLDASIGTLKMGKAQLDHIQATLNLAGGRLAIDPLKAMLGGSAVAGRVELDASGSPARYSLTLKAPNMEIADLLRAGGLSPFVTGKGDADIDLSGSGASAHDMAASTAGHILVTAMNGTVSAAAAGSVAEGLTQILAPGGNTTPALDCLALRYSLANGVAKNDGVLADSSASTVAGAGGFNLGAETIDMTLHAKPKLVNVGGLLPPLSITGPLSGPHFGVDARGEVRNVASQYLGGTLNKLLGGKGASPAATDAVPTILKAPAGQNDCVYTLDHPAAAPAATGNAAPAAKPANPIKNLGNAIKGLFGH